MKQYYKEENGVKTWLNNILIIGDSQIINPTEEQILKAGYIEYNEPISEISDAQLLENVRRGKLLQLHSYDSSKNVNSCTIKFGNQTLEYWADKHERDSLKNAVRDCIEMGRETYRLDLRDLKVSITVKCSQLLKLLSALEVYAVDCYNMTTDHEYAIKNCLNQQEIVEYDYTVGYPEKLEFNL